MMSSSNTDSSAGIAKAGGQPQKTQTFAFVSNDMSLLFSGVLSPSLTIF